jgi:CheY-like chemotaxis protein
MQVARDKLEILLIEDYDDTRELYATALRLAGYEVIEARDGSAALERLREHVPDLVLLDIGLPGMDGFQVAAKIREQPGLAETPIVLVSAYVQSRNAEELAGKAGAIFALSKPCAPEELIGAVDSVLRRTRAAMIS